MSIDLIPCKNLDYAEGKYGPDIELRDCAPDYPQVWYWHRGDRWTYNGAGQPTNPASVQFCAAGRGRINGIFQCYMGEMHCYEPETEGQTCTAQSTKT